MKDFNVDVYIKESRDIKNINVPELRSGNEINPNEKGNLNNNRNFSLLNYVYIFLFLLSKHPYKCTLY